MCSGLLTLADNLFQFRFHSRKTILDSFHALHELARPVVGALKLLDLIQLPLNDGSRLQQLVAQMLPEGLEPRGDVFLTCDH